MLEIIALIFSVVAIIISALCYFQMRRQTKAMEKPKPDDEPINPYTIKLDAIIKALHRIADSLSNKN